MHKFKTWDAIVVKTYLALKTFFHETYDHKLNALELQNTTRSLGYAPPTNMSNILDLGNNDDSATNVSIATIQAAATATGYGTIAANSMGQGTAGMHCVHPGLIMAINKSIALAFNQVVQYQVVLQKQIMTKSHAQPQLHMGLYMEPLVPHVAFPMQHPAPNAAATTAVSATATSLLTIA